MRDDCFSLREFHPRGTRKKVIYATPRDVVHSEEYPSSHSCSVGVAGDAARRRSTGSCVNRILISLRASQFRGTTSP